ncbi:unnamed protein product [Victoria cruziana]
MQLIWPLILKMTGTRVIVPIEDMMRLGYEQNSTSSSEHTRMRITKGKHSKGTNHQRSEEMKNTQNVIVDTPEDLVIKILVHAYIVESWDTSSGNVQRREKSSKEGETPTSRQSARHLGRVYATTVNDIKANDLIEGNKDTSSLIVFSLLGVHRSSVQTLGVRHSSVQALGVRRSSVQALGVRRSSMQALSVRCSSVQALSVCCSYSTCLPCATTLSH